MMTASELVAKSIVISIMCTLNNRAVKVYESTQFFSVLEILYASLVSV